MDGLGHGSGSGSTAKDDRLLLLLMLRMPTGVVLVLRVRLVHVRVRVLLLLLLLMRTWLHLHLLRLLLLCGMLSVDGRLHAVGSAGRHWSLMLHMECIVGHHLGSRERADLGAPCTAKEARRWARSRWTTGCGYRPKRRV